MIVSIARIELQQRFQWTLQRDIGRFVGSLEPGAAVLAATLYFWQIPHFLSLAWLHREDYMRGGYAMLSR